MQRWNLQVSAGTGPSEVRLFVGLLASALEEDCLACGLEVESLSHCGPESSPRSATLVVLGNAPTSLAHVIGTHVLVARSASRGRGRKRWFAGVSLHAIVRDPTQRAPLRLCDLLVKAARASGPGGQHVNTTDSAVRVTHLPSGISVRVASERSQHQNRRVAVQRIETLLSAKVAEHQQRARGRARLHHYHFERGSAVQVWTMGRKAKLIRKD